jgi:hypothetical protein
MALILSSNSGNITAGGDNSDGDLILNANNGDTRIHLDAGSGNIYAGGFGADGDLVMMPASATSQSAAASTIHISADSGNITAGGNGTDGDLLLLSDGGATVIHLDGGNGNIFAGGDGADGDLVLRDGTGADRIRMSADSGNITAGGNGTDGDLLLLSGGGATVIHLDGGNGNIFAGGDGADGDLVLRDGTGADRIRMSADSGNLYIGGNGADGDIVVFASTGDNATLSQATIHINGDSGDIILQNADFAEDFDIRRSDGAAAAPGAVMVLCDSGELTPCTAAYDRRVAGIISGAGGFRSGIIMDKQRNLANRQAVALIGKVYCQVDATHGSIAVGDLLTTSPTPGHAMVARDPARAFGATIGKALAPHTTGTGLIPVLVTLQ